MSDNLFLTELDWVAFHIGKVKRQDLKRVFAPQQSAHEYMFTDIVTFALFHSIQANPDCVLVLQKSVSNQNELSGSFRNSSSSGVDFLPKIVFL